MCRGRPAAARPAATASTLVLSMRKGPCGREHSKSLISAFVTTGPSACITLPRPFSESATSVVVLALEGETSVRRIAVILSLAVLAGSCRGRGKKDEQYKTEKADRGDITQTVTATGGLSAVTTVQVGSQVSGVIARLYADFNSRVKKGQLLAELDPTPFQAQVEQRQADLTKASVEAANAKVNLTRQDRLVKAGIGVAADYDTAKANYEADVAQVAQARAALSQANTNLNYTKIISPIDGIVVDRAYDVGQTVAASFQAPTLFQIAQDLTKMQA